MRCGNWAAVGVLSSALAWPGAAQERRNDSASPAADVPPTAPCVNVNACSGIVHRYQHGRQDGREEARAAIDRVRELCADGEGMACLSLAHWTAEGIDDLVAP